MDCYLYLLLCNFPVVLQVPITDEQRYAPILCFVIRHMQMSVDPLLYAWLLYQPSTTGLPSKKPGQNSSR